MPSSKEFHRGLRKCGHLEQQRPRTETYHERNTVSSWSLKGLSVRVVGRVSPSGEVLGISALRRGYCNTNYAKFDNTPRNFEQFQHRWLPRPSAGPSAVARWVDLVKTHSTHIWCTGKSNGRQGKRTTGVPWHKSKVPKNGATNLPAEPRAAACWCASHQVASWFKHANKIIFVYNPSAHQNEFSCKVA